MSEPDVLTAEDVRDLNRLSVERAAAFVRIAGSVLVGVGAAGVAAWLWTAVRAQQELLPAGTFTFSDSLPSRSASWVDRVDVLAPYLGLLVTAVAVAGFGLLFRLAADFAVDRVGGTTTGFAAGDRLEESDSSDDLEPT
jgi:hypothetical protein